MARFSSHLLLFLALGALLLALASATSSSGRGRGYEQERSELEACKRLVQRQGVEDERRRCCGRVRDIPERERCSELMDVFGRGSYFFVDSPGMEQRRRGSEDQEEQQRLASRILQVCNISPYDCQSRRYSEDPQED